jgi:cytochrome c oxidase cbb3-type subunit 3
MCSHCRSGERRAASCDPPSGQPRRADAHRPAGSTLAARRSTLAAALALLAACSGEPPARDVALSTDRAVVLTSDLQAGAPMRASTRNPLEGDQRALAEGERLYLWMNCAGCHGPKGGGAIGPPLRDADWIYGRDPAVIHQSIRQGRPNGMPSFGGRLPDAQIWQIVLYVEKLADEGAKQASEKQDAARAER